MRGKLILSELKNNNTKGGHWKKYNDFQLKSTNTYLLNRKVTFKNEVEAPKIKEITFLGYKTNKLRISIKFKTEEMLRSFIQNNTLSLKISGFSDGKLFYYDPGSQDQLDDILTRINQFDQLGEDFLKELPLILNTRIDKHTEPAESYPPFESELRGAGSRFSIDNSLSYALAVQGSGIPNMNEFDEQESDAEKLRYTVKEINTYYQNDRLALVAPNDTGKLPVPRDGYYLMAMFVSSEGTAYVDGNKHYQTRDYHFVGQNNDGLFSHRRGTGNLPLKNDSEDRPITIPEQAKLFYVFGDGSFFYDEDYNRIPVCADYKFVGYIYVQVVSHRLNNFPADSYRMLDEIESKAEVSPQINDLLTEFKKGFFLYPPQLEFFSDARDKILSFYQKVQKVVQVKVSQAVSEMSAHVVHGFFTLSTDLQAVDSDQSEPGVVKYV